MTAFDGITAELREAIEPLELHEGDGVQVEVGLRRCLLSSDWSAEEHAFLDKLARKLDITRRIDVCYDDDWGKVDAAEITQPWRSVAALLLCRAFAEQQTTDAEDPIVLKRVNVAHKALDYLAKVDKTMAERLAQALATAQRSYEPQNSTATLATDAAPAVSGTRELPLTVLFSEGPIARAYLETIASLGLRPRKIVHLVSALDVATGKEVLRWLPAGLRKPMAASMQRNRMFHWPDAIARQHPDAVAAIIDEVSASLGFNTATLQGAQRNKPLIEYGDRVDTLLIKNLNDPVLLRYVQAETGKQFLFTGGGIVPAELLDVPESKFIHVHPGYLPEIRGADCLLWSILSRGRPSASAFYMAPGIDTGDVMLAHWLPAISVAVAEKVDLVTRYRMAYALVDPWVRSAVLRDLLHTHTDFAAIAATAQEEASGLTYHFMHDQLRALALQELFPSS